MSKALVEKLRRARESKVEVEGHAFTIRRPTDADIVAMRSVAGMDYVCKFVVGWDLVELDVIAGGGPEPVPFDTDLWTEWVADKPALWGPLSLAIMAAYSKHVEALESAKKN